MNPATPILVGSYSYLLVALSIVIAVMASYTALDLGGRVTAAQGVARRSAWLIGGAIALGSGIWSMHYVGMLAFRLPVPILYDAPTVSLSLLAAILLGGHSGLRGSSVCRQPKEKRIEGDFGGHSGGGRGRRSYALHRHGRHETSVDVPPFHWARQLIGTASCSDFVRGAVAGLPLAVATHHAKRPAPKVAKLMNEWRAQGKTLRAIATDLNRLNIRPPRGRQWFASSVSNQLTQPATEQR